MSLYWYDELTKKNVSSTQSLHINQVNEREVRLGDQFILSCVAQGSYGITFLWYKDDMLVDMAKATRWEIDKHLCQKFYVISIDQPQLFILGLSDVTQLPVQWIRPDDPF